jgi:hypothetical protein
MSVRFIGLLCGGLALVSAASASAAAPINANVRVEGAKKTLVSERAVTLADAPIIKDGNPDHSCPGQSALGALQQGTQGNWEGKWFEGLGYDVLSIKGETPKGSGYFELWVNHKLSSDGVCGHVLNPGDDVLLFVENCTYDPALQACKHPTTPLGVRVPHTVRRRHHVHITVVDYSATGKATPEPGATVYANGKRLGRTDKHGQILVGGAKVGKVTISAAEAGKARSEVETVRVRA